MSRHPFLSASACSVLLPFFINSTLLLQRIVRADELCLRQFAGRQKGEQQSLLIGIQKFAISLAGDFPGVFHANKMEACH